MDVLGYMRRKNLRLQREMQNLQNSKEKEKPVADDNVEEKPSSPEVPPTPDTDYSETQEGRAEGIEIEGMETAAEGGDNVEIIMKED